MYVLFIEQINFKTKENDISVSKPALELPPKFSLTCNPQNRCNMLSSRVLNGGNSLLGCDFSNVICLINLGL